MSFVILHNIDCIQMNAMHCRDAASLLSYQLSCMESFAVMLQEPFYDGKGHIYGYDDFQVFQGALNPRACIILPRNQNAMLVNEFSDKDIATVCIKLKGQVTYINSIYMHRKGKKFKINPRIPKMFQKCKELGNGIIICADTNVHTPIIGGVYVSDKPGKLIEELLLTYNLIAHNQGNTPTFHINKRKSFIDLTASSPDLRTEIKNWEVDEEFNFSDHNTIRFSINASFDVPEAKLNHHKCNWDAFVKKCTKQAGKISNRNDVKSLENLDKFATDVQETVIRIRDECTPTFSTKNKRHCKSWWSEDLTRRHEEVNNLYIRLKRNWSSDLQSEYKDKKRLYSHEIASQKQLTWENCVQTSNPHQIPANS
jgi:hypothetical protein